MEGVITALIWLLIYALVIAVIAFIVVRLVATFAPSAAVYAWIIWCIGGLILLLLALRLFGSVIPAPP